MLKPGDQVSHATYGIGIVKLISTSTVTVQFSEPYGEQTVDIASVRQLLFS